MHYPKGWLEKDALNPGLFIVLVTYEVIYLYGFFLFINDPFFEEMLIYNRCKVKNVADCLIQLMLTFYCTKSMAKAMSKCTWIWVKLHILSLALA